MKYLPAGPEAGGVHTNGRNKQTRNAKGRVSRVKLAPTHRLVTRLAASYRTRRGGAKKKKKASQRNVLVERRLEPYFGHLHGDGNTGDLSPVALIASLPTLRNIFLVEAGIGSRLTTDEYVPFVSSDDTALLERLQRGLAMCTAACRAACTLSGICAREHLPESQRLIGRT